jgi:site-specific recombinase XerD
MKKGVTVSDFKKQVEYFIDIRENTSRVSRETLLANRKDIKMFLNYLQLKKCTHVNGPVMLGYLSYLRQERKNKADAANRKMETLKTYLRFLCCNDVNRADEIPLESFRRLKPESTGQKNTPTFKEIQEMFKRIADDSPYGKRDRIVFFLMYHLGLRIGEVHRITLDDIDFETGKIIIHGKGRKIRELGLVPQVIELLEKYRVDIRPFFLNADKSNALFLSKKGKPLAVRSIEHNFQKYFKGFYPRSCERLVPHTLRHAFATHYLENSDDMVTLKNIMGHKYMKSTEAYLHCTMEMLRKALNNHPAVKMLEEAMEKYKFKERFKSTA